MTNELTEDFGKDAVMERGMAIKNCVPAIAACVAQYWQCRFNYTSTGSVSCNSMRDEYMEERIAEALICSRCGDDAYVQELHTMSYWTEFTKADTDTCQRPRGEGSMTKTVRQIHGSISREGMTVS